MKKLTIVALFAAVLVQAAAANAGMNINVDLYGPPPVVVSPPPTVVYDAPPPRHMPQSAPQFAYSPDLGYYVSAAPYDMAYIGRSYYLYRDGYWYMSSSYAGPWTFARGRMIPPELRRYSYSEFRVYRDRACHNERWEHRGWERGGRWHDRDHDRWERHANRW